MNKLFVTVLSLALAVSPAAALEWQVMGPRAMGMGGAGVALTQGPVASYWNPGALGRPTENAYGLQVPFSAHAALTGSVIEGANDFKNLNCPNGPNCTDANVQKALTEMNEPGNGVRADASVGGDFKVGRFSFFLNGFLDAGGVPRMDLVNNTAATAANNTSALIVKGATIGEFGVGYGHELPFFPGMYLGADVKAMKAKVGYAKYLILQNNNNSSNFLSTLKNGAVQSSAFGVDAGALWDVHRTFDFVPLHPRFGIVGRNLNNPKFDQPAAAIADGVTGKFAVNPQTRAGVSLSPFHWWNIAADLDLSRNLTPVDNVASRQASLGTEINVFNRSWLNIPLRAGLSKNLAESESGTMLSLGAGLNFLHLMVDLAGTVSPKTIQTQSQGKTVKVPREMGASLQIGLLFGGSEDDDKPRPSASGESRDLPNAQADQVRQDAEKAQQELNKAGQ